MNGPEAETEVDSTAAGDEQRQDVAVTDDIEVVVEAASSDAGVGGEPAPEPESDDGASDRQALDDQATQLEGDLDDVDAALKRLDDGAYATCESCGATLSDEQLVAEPTRRTCVDGCAAT